MKINVHVEFHLLLCITVILSHVKHWVELFPIKMVAVLLCEAIVEHCVR